MRTLFAQRTQLSFASATSARLAASAFVALSKASRCVARSSTGEHARASPQIPPAEIRISSALARVQQQTHPARAANPTAAISDSN